MAIVCRCRVHLRCEWRCVKDTAQTESYTHVVVGRVRLVKVAHRGDDGSMKESEFHILAESDAPSIAKIATSAPWILPRFAHPRNFRSVLHLQAHYLAESETLLIVSTAARPPSKLSHFAHPRNFRRALHLQHLYFPAPPSPMISPNVT